jgi:hypothetical protein
VLIAAIIKALGFDLPALGFDLHAVGAILIAAQCLGLAAAVFAVSFIYQRFVAPHTLRAGDPNLTPPR